MATLQPPNAATDGGAYDAGTGAGAGCYDSLAQLADPFLKGAACLKAHREGMYTHFFTGIPHGFKNIPEDVSSANGDGARGVVDSDVLEAAHINTNAVLQFS